MLLRGG
ncbi:uncharacterized protein FFC1_12980 [Fusarium fujikuroi]|nr:uncharacterized protein FFC1_12980 [Fusarium fujikuroi]